MKAHAQGKNRLAGQQAERGADREAPYRCPDQVDGNPSRQTGAQLVMAEQAQAKHHEGKCRAIVEAAFPGQAETNDVPVFGVLHLHVGGEHWVGRRKDGAGKDRDAERQAEPPDPYRAYPGDGEQHRHTGKLDRQSPYAI